MDSNLILKQMQMLWCDLRDPKTGGTLLQALTKIGRLLIQVLLLMILLILLGLAGVVWFWGVAYQAGREDRQWLEQHPDIGNNEFAMYVISKNLLAPFKWLVALANEFLYVILGVKPKNSLSPTTAGQKQLSAATTAPATTLALRSERIEA